MKKHILSAAIAAIISFISTNAVADQTVIIENKTKSLNITFDYSYNRSLPDNFYGMMPFNYGPKQISHAEQTFADDTLGNNTTMKYTIGSCQFDVRPSEEGKFLFDGPSSGLKHRCEIIGNGTDTVTINVYDLA